MWTLLAAWSFTTSRRLFQIGILLDGVGAGFVAVAGLGLLRPQPLDTSEATSRSRASFTAPALIIGGVLMVGGLILMILTVHYGVSPFSPRPK